MIDSLVVDKEQAGASERWRAWQNDGIARDRGRGRMVTWLLVVLVTAWTAWMLIEVF